MKHSIIQRVAALAGVWACLGIAQVAKCAIVAAAALFAAGAAQALEVDVPAKYVATPGDGGSDATGDGSAEKPYESAQKAVDALGADGGVVEIAAGTYALTNEIAITAPIILRGASRETTFFDVSAKSGVRCVVLSNALAKVSGLTFKGARDVTGGGVLICGGRVEDCAFTDCGGATGAALATSSAHAANWTIPTVSRCVFTNNTTSGSVVCAVKEPWRSCGLHMDNCLIANNTGVAFRREWSEWAGGDSCQLSNCTFVVDSGTVLSAVANVYLFNCIAYGVSDGRVVATHTCFAGASATTNKCTIKKGCILVDNPRFKNAAAHDYRLTSDSPCLNAGGQPVAYLYDLEGRARTSGTAPDMGCYEYDLSRAVCTLVWAPEVVFAGDTPNFTVKVFDDGAEHDYAYTVTLTEKRGGTIVTNTPTFALTFDEAGLYDIRVDVVDRDDPTYGASYEKAAGFNVAASGPVSSLRSTGTQCINTGVIPNASTRVVIKLAYSDLDNVGQNGFGANWSAQSFRFGRIKVDGVLRFFSNVNNSFGQCNYATCAADDQVHTFDISAAGSYCDGVEMTGASGSLTSTCAGAIYLFAYYTQWHSKPEYFSKASILSCKIYSGETLVRDLVPWRKDDGTLCFKNAAYVSGNSATGNEYYLNAGSGVFKIGVAECVTVRGSPSDYGKPVPGYGVKTDLSVGTAYTFTCPAVYTNAAATIAAACQGYTFALTNGEVYAGSALSTSIVYSVETACSRLTWLWEAPQFKATVVTRCDGEEATASSFWSDSHGRVVVTAPAAPKTGFAFSHWEGTPIHGSDRTRATLSLTLTQPATLTAVYVPARYVATPGDGGSDATGDGSAEKPYESARKAVDALGADGGVVEVAAGTYALTSEIMITAPIILRGASCETTFFDVSATSGVRCVVLSNALAKVSGLTFKGARDVTGGGVLMCGGRVEDCAFTDCGGATGAALATSSAHAENWTIPTVSRCVFTNNTTSGSVVCEVANSYGIHMDNCLIANNTGLAFHREWMQWGGTGCQLSNCTFVVDSGTVLSGVAAVRLFNCIMYGKIGFQSWNKWLVVATHTCFAGAGATTDGCQIDEGCIFKDPLFADAAAHDYRLASDSPSLNAGGRPVAYLYDLEGRARTSGSAPDMGCYEYDSRTILLTNRNNKKQERNKKP